MQLQEHMLSTRCRVTFGAAESSKGNGDGPSGLEDAAARCFAERGRLAPGAFVRDRERRAREGPVGRVIAPQSLAAVPFTSLSERTQGSSRLLLGPFLSLPHWPCDTPDPYSSRH